MVSQELLTYIQQAQEKNISLTEISAQLITAGWPKESVDEAIAVSKGAAAGIPLPPSPPQGMQKIDTQASMWDAFEHVLMFISLYVMVTTIVLILEYFIDRWVPGVTGDYTAVIKSDFSLNMLRIYMASLIVSYPIFSFFFIEVTKRTQQNPAIRNLRARKIWIYITLVITFLLMVSNVINVIYTFLSGNVTINFILHFLVIVGVSGIIFAHYVLQVKEDRKIDA